MDEATRTKVMSGLRQWLIKVGVNEIDPAVNHIMKFIDGVFESAEEIKKLEEVTPVE
jgi:hypothetical protein